VASIGLVLFRAVVAQTDLVLVIEPSLIVLGLRGVNYPLPKALADRAGIRGIELAGIGILVVSAQVRVIKNDAAPGLEQVVNLVLEDIER